MGVMMAMWEVVGAREWGLRVVLVLVLVYFSDIVTRMRSKAQDRLIMDPFH